MKDFLYGCAATLLVIVALMASNPPPKIAKHVYAECDEYNQFTTNGYVYSCVKLQPVGNEYINREQQDNE